MGKKGRKTFRPLNVEFLPAPYEKQNNSFEDQLGHTTLANDILNQICTRNVDNSLIYSSEVKDILNYYYAKRGFKKTHGTICSVRSNFVHDPKFDRSTNFLLGNSFANVIQITGDGNCLYNSISYCLFRTEKYNKDLRVICVKTIIEYAEFFEKIIMYGLIEGVETLKDLIIICATNRVFANEGSIYALCIALKRYIVIMQSNDVIYKIKPFENNVDKPIVVHLSNPGRATAHYSAVFFGHNSEIAVEQIIDLSSMINYA